MRWIAIILIIFISCKQDTKVADQRPRYHFTPAKNWTNDPNGLVYFDGEYHIFYQYNPYGDKWGHMSWGHAVSKDLLHWEHLPVAIEEYTDAAGDSVMIFSGSAVVDSSKIVAVYTSHIHRRGEQIRQNQSIAISNDRGRSFTRYEKNPVLDIERKDFRDPKAFWYEEGKKWVMTVAVPDLHKVQFYESKDLKEWKLLSSFGKVGDTTKIWECPDLFPLGNKWVLLISNSHPQGGPFVGMQYFIGDFDGTTFVADSLSQYPLYVDYGKDFYAGVTFNNAPGGRRIMIGWANNWAYAGDIPTHPWRGAMSLPRVLSLYETAEGLRLKQEAIAPDEIVKEIELGPGDTINISGAVIGYDGAEEVVYFDRRNAGNTTFNTSFPSIEKAPARLVDGKVKLKIYVDASIVEIYINGGEAVITEQVFPAHN